jgi:electron transfer flavoprotein beta subunit
VHIGGFGMPRFIVCVKQALDVAKLKVDPVTLHLLTVGVPRKISDFDKNALEEAVRLKEKSGGEVLTVTLGSEDAKINLREALAMGADKAYLLSDPLFVDSDTLATSYVLAEAIKKIGNFDLVICGEVSVDSFSAQVGPRVAERLGIPQITYVRSLKLDGDEVTAERSLEDCYEVVRAKTPVLVTVTGEINEPRIPSLMAIMKASRKEIITWNSEDLDFSNRKVVENSSAVQVLETLALKVERRRTVITGETPMEIADKVVKALIEEGVLKV